jgi:hypothetical protein
MDERDRELISKAAYDPTYAELIVRLKDAVEKQTASADALGRRIARLNCWLLVFTIAIFALTVVLVWMALKGRA